MRKRAVLWFALFASALSIGGVAFGQSEGVYRSAERSFLAQPVSSRIDLQHLLTAAGYWASVSNEEFGKRLFAAICEFQRKNGYACDGVVTAEQRRRLQELAAPALTAWRLSVVKHPDTGTPLWVPQGFGLTTTRLSYGLAMNSAMGSVIYSFFPGSDIQSESARLTPTSSDEIIDYKVVRSDFIVIVSHTPYASVYSRYHNTPSGVLGFNLVWKNDEPNYGDRLATMMSDLFRATLASKNAAPPLLNR